MFRSIQTFSVNGKFTERYHFFCARIDLLFTIFVCSRYGPWAAIRLLHHFGFVMCINSRLYCTHFSCHWRKIRNVSCQLTQISKRQRDPCYRHGQIHGFALDNEHSSNSCTWKVISLTTSARLQQSRNGQIHCLAPDNDEHSSNSCTWKVISLTA